MALSNKERVGRALELLTKALRAYVEQELRAVYGDRWKYHLKDADTPGNLDIIRLCGTLLDTWDDVFYARLPREARAQINTVRNGRNEWAHADATGLTGNQTLQTLLAAQRLLEMINDPAADEVERLGQEVMYAKFQAELKKEQRKIAQATLPGIGESVYPWRTIAQPHEDVASGRFQQAEFAADLWQVYQGGGADEYRDPVAFFGRTFLTAGLRELLINALHRLRGAGGDPVVELKINFGGGKTHSMLALYHLFGGQAKASELPGIPDVLREVKAADAPVVRRAVLVGTSLRPGSPLRHEDGIETRTLWGEIAWQLAGAEGYALVSDVDQNATNPGDLMDQLFALAGPSLILIDEWVAYARQLFDRENRLPAGDFDTQFTFAQTLCEAARRAGNVLVCISIPASERDGVLYGSQAGDVAGRAALERLQDAVGRSNMVWRPASSDESFEIVRRRLFQPIPSDKIAARDAVINEFCTFYRANPGEFPAECREGAYRERMKAAYPIHPELFDRLYNDWSTLEKFQRTRGVLRLMASVIHALWNNDDRSALILPASVPLCDPAVQSEVLRYLPENWSAVIDTDVDGENSLPVKLDREYSSSYGKYLATRRVARTCFLGSAPTKDTANRGLDALHIKLGSVQPKETVATFGDALNRLSQQATYLYADRQRYWYNTRPSVNRMADDRAEQVSEEAVHTELAKRLRTLLSDWRRAGVRNIHIANESSDIPDDRELRLVVLPPAHRHRQNRPESGAVSWAMDCLQYRGQSPRVYRNRLLFLALDDARYGDLHDSVRRYLAWCSILEECKNKLLDLDHANQAQATSTAERVNQEVTAKLGEALCWSLCPEQIDPKEEVSLTAYRISGDVVQKAESLVKKLKNEQALVETLGAQLLRNDMDRIPLWREDTHARVEQLVEDYARYIYLSRLMSDKTLYDAVSEELHRLDGTSAFGVADGWDETTGTWIRPRHTLDGAPVSAVWLIKPELVPETTETPGALPIETTTKEPPGGYGGMVEATTGSAGITTAIPPEPPRMRRFHASVELAPETFRQKTGTLSQEIISHLTGVLGSQVRITVEITAESSDGFPDDLQRTIKENSRTLNLTQYGFEEE